MLLPIMFVLVCGMVGAPWGFGRSIARTTTTTPAPAPRPAATTPQPASQTTPNLAQEYTAAEQSAFAEYKRGLAKQIIQDIKSPENLAFKLESTLNMQRPSYFGLEFVQYNSSIRSLHNALIKEETEHNPGKPVDFGKIDATIKSMPIPDFNPKASTNPLITYFNRMREICRDIRKAKYKVQDSTTIKFDARRPYQNERTILENAAGDTAQILAAMPADKRTQTINEALETT